MSIFDNVRRRFATIGRSPPFKEDEPVSFGEGIIKRIKLQKANFNPSYKGEYEPHIGQPRTYMNVYLQDPIVRTLIDLPCFYSVKDSFDIVTDEDKVLAKTCLLKETNMDRLCIIIRR